VSSEWLTAFAAFLSGAGSVLGAWYAIRAVHKRDEQECEKRFQAFREGLERGEHHDT